jgi:uncharacterized phage protein (TIGR01671 family)
MREIKFRAWSKSENLMGEVTGFRFSKSQYPCVDVRFKQNGKIINERYCFGQEDGCDSVILMQFTGLYDKNGTEIYEGDIVELTNTYKGMNTKSIVEIDFIDFTFAGKWAEEYSPSGYMYNPLGSYNFPIVTIEVIGNIYENPELLKE